MNPLKYPKLMVVAAFLLLLAAWSSLIMVAAKHSPKPIEVVRPTR
ncbi:hypothetical protein GCM10023212_18380 [Luteolibacter yonseiensis]|nr:hypothetical protein [Luteolibacter yonseiensis]